MQAVYTMKVVEKEVEAYRRVTCRLKWFALQGMPCVERLLAAWGFSLGDITDVIQPHMLHMNYTYVGVGGVH